MHAFAPALPLLASKTALIGPNRSLPPLDSFKTVLQGRLAAHLRRVAAGGAAKKQKAPQEEAKPESQTPANRRRRSVISCQTGRSSRGGPRTVPPERLPEAAALLLQAGFPLEPLERLLTDLQIQKEGLNLDDLRRAWRKVQADASTGAGSEPGWVAAGLPQGSPSTVLAGLLELTEQSPGKILPIPATRQPEIAALLSEAGFTPGQIESLLASPQVQEHGLTAEVLRAVWLKSVNAVPVQEDESFRLQAMQQLTGCPDYHRLWERLRLPVQAMPDLRLALQQLGASPDALAGLEEHVTPQGVPVGQIWRIIKQTLSEGQAVGSQAGAASFAKPDHPAAPPSGEELAQWRQLLGQIGFSPEAVESLLGSQTPASAGELGSRLAALAPSAPPSDLQDAPKPLYMPESLRLRSLWWENQDALEQDLGEGESGHAFWSNPGKFEPLTSSATKGQGTFSSLLTLAASSPAFSGANKGEGIGGQWGPEVRQAFWSQLESAILGNLKPGENRLNLMLNPPHLGRIELIFNLKGEELAVTAMMARPEVAHLAGAGVEQLAQALSQQGLILSQFQVQVRAGAPEAFSSPTEQKAMHKREQDASGGEAARRRRNNRVDRFV